MFRAGLPIKPAILKSDLSQQLKAQFRTTSRCAKFFAVEKSTGVLRRGRASNKILLSISPPSGEARDAFKTNTTTIGETCRGGVDRDDRRRTLSFPQTEAEDWDQLEEKPDGDLEV